MTNAAAKLTRQIKAHLQLAVGVLSGVLLWFVLPLGWHRATRLLTAWDCTATLYLILMLGVMARSNVERIRSRAAMQERRVVILALATITALVSLAAIVAELSERTPQGHVAPHQIALAGLTVFLSWTFLHTMFALHYAHEYYTGPRGTLAQGLEFPGHEPPDYWDFIYYSFVIGTACATADVNVTSRVMRRITAAHCVVAFFFNTTILALTVNIGAGLF